MHNRHRRNQLRHKYSRRDFVDNLRSRRTRIRQAFIKPTNYTPRPYYYKPTRGGWAPRVHRKELRWLKHGLPGVGGIR